MRDKPISALTSDADNSQRPPLTRSKKRHVVEWNPTPHAEVGARPSMKWRPLRECLDEIALPVGHRGALDLGRFNGGVGGMVCHHDHTVVPSAKRPTERRQRTRLSKNLDGSAACNA